MAKMTVEGIITEDHKLVVQLPKSYKPGPVKIILHVPKSVSAAFEEDLLSHEEIVQLLKAAGLTADSASVLDEAEDDEWAMVILPSSAGTTKTLTNED